MLEALGIANACYRLETRRRESKIKELDVSAHMNVAELVLNFRYYDVDFGKMRETIIIILYYYIKFDV